MSAAHNSPAAQPAEAFQAPHAPATLDSSEKLDGPVDSLVTQSFISRQIAEAHGGTLKADNIVDKATGELAGARFTLSLPTGTQK